MLTSLICMSLEKKTSIPSLCNAAPTRSRRDYQLSYSLTGMGFWKWTGTRSREKKTIRPNFVELRSSGWFVTTVVSYANATDIFMYELIAPMAPTALESRVGISEGSLQTWNSILLALFGVGLLVTSPIAGHIADRFESRRYPYLFALVGLGAATALLFVGNHIGFWISGRLFQGAASAVVWVVGNALVADTVGKDGVGKAIGYTKMACCVGLLAGPLVGGVVYQMADTTLLLVSRLA